MKKRLIIISLMICWVSIEAQQKVITGTVEVDGYNKITKGAFWTTRPEAKMVYYGQTPSGVEVITLQSNHFVRFAKGENNRLDINYIVFPKGEKVYIKNGEYFAAICGNRISFIQPVEMVEIREIEVEKIVEVEKPIYLSPKSVISSPVQDQWKTTEPEKDRVDFPQNPIPKKKSWFVKNLGWIIPTGVGILGFVANDSNHYWYLWFLKNKPQGTMSNGRSGNETTTGSGTQDGGRSD